MVKSAFSSRASIAFESSAFATSMRGLPGSLT